MKIVLKKCLVALLILIEVFLFYIPITPVPVPLSPIKNQNRGRMLKPDYTYIGRYNDEVIQPGPTNHHPEQYDIILESNLGNLTYYNQEDARWAKMPYGTDPIDTYGCGPTVLSMLVNSFTATSTNPPQMAQWAYENGFYSKGGGSYHSIIPEGAKSFGLVVKSFHDYTAEAIIDELNSGKIITVLMRKGHFTAGGHFLILLGTTPEGKIRIADPKSIINTNIVWDPEIIINEAKYTAKSGGPMWSISLN